MATRATYDMMMSSRRPNRRSDEELLPDEAIGISGIGKTLERIACKVKRHYGSETVVLPCHEQLTERNFMKVPPCRSRSETRAEEASQRRPWVSSMILENDNGHVTDSLEVNRMTRYEDRFTGGESGEVQHTRQKVTCRTLETTCALRGSY